MKRIEKGVEPVELREFCSNHPEATWDDFKKKAPVVYRELKAELGRRQQGLCAYCESALSTEPDGRCVDHFHPKSDRDGGKNWHLVYDNLFLSCLGGRKKPLSSEKTKKTNFSCDAKKGDKILDGQVVTPFEVPESPMIFQVNSNGEIKPHVENCRQAGISEQTVKKTIEELGLNCMRLQRARQAVWEGLSKMVVCNSSSFDSARQLWLTPCKANQMHDFITTMRSFFDPVKHSSEHPQKS